MQTQQLVLKTATDAAPKLATLAALQPGLVLVFGAPNFFTDDAFIGLLATTFPEAIRIGCSTAGEITARGVGENTCVVTAVRFDHATTLRAASTTLADMADSRGAGERLAAHFLTKQATENQATGNLAPPMIDVQAVMVFGQGLNINGSALIDGMSAVLGDSVTITGGLAGDNGAFARTWVLGQEGASDRAIVAVALAGERLSLAHGSFGGWEPFGPARKVTRCAGNVLFELDGEPALAVYKHYLGSYAKDLPASGLLFPFAMLGEDRNAIGLIRTILGINEADGSLVLAGEIQADGYLKLMHASTDKLVDGAEAAAKAAIAMQRAPGGLAVLVSCVGRKLVMGDRIDDEIEAVGSVLGANTVLTGFYSYGEISPFAPGVACKLHNQTMTITCIGEK